MYERREWPGRTNMTLVPQRCSQCLLNLWLMFQHRVVKYHPWIKICFWGVFLDFTVWPLENEHLIIFYERPANNYSLVEIVYSVSGISLRQSEFLGQNVSSFIFQDNSVQNSDYWKYIQWITWYILAIMHVAKMCFHKFITIVLYKSFSYREVVNKQHFSTLLYFTKLFT